MSEVNNELIKTYKLVLLGDPGVGKTSLRKRYLGESFSSSYKVTIGADIAFKKIIYQNQEYRFQIWDLSGQVGFKTVRGFYYQNVAGALFVFDLTTLQSLKNLKEWQQEIHEHNSGIPSILIGNKVDLVDKTNLILMDEVDDHNSTIFSGGDGEVPLILTSALTGENVDSAFSILMDQFLK